MVDDEALGSMLISWYMSGYHTGFYLVCAREIFDLVWVLYTERLAIYVDHNNFFLVQGLKEGRKKASNWTKPQRK